MNSTAFLVIGYIAFSVYTIGIMLLGELLERKSSLNKMICRKVTHIVSAGVWVICYIFFGCSIHWVVLNGIGAAILCMITFGKWMTFADRDDAEKSYGLFYFGLSTFLVALACYLADDRLYLYTGISYYCLAIGDGLAPIAAHLAGKRNRVIKDNKTIVGTVTVFLASFAATVVFNQLLNTGLDLLFMLSVAALTCVVEFYGYKGTDNLLIEFAVFGYLVLYHYGLVSATLEIVLIVSPLLATLAVGCGAMSRGAGAISLLLFLAVGFFGDTPIPVLFITLLFTLATGVHLITTRLFYGEKQSDCRKQMRRGKQIVAVGLWGALSLVLHYFSKMELFKLLFFLSLTEQFADSMASDIGRLTRHRNINIITLKPIEKGLSGGMSVLGSGCALVSALLLMAVPLLLDAVSWQVYLGISLLSFVGMVVDSVLGGLVQILYRCSVCHIRTENAEHCGEKTVRVKGISFIGNSEVNFITGLITCGLGGLLLLL